MKQKIECDCGCVYEIALDDGECSVTARLVECPMCFNGEETEESCIDTVNDTVNDTGLLMDVVSKVKIPKGRFQVNKKENIRKEAVEHKKPKHRRTKYTPEICDFIKENLNQNSNNEMRELLKEKFDLDVNYLQFASLLIYKKIRRDKNQSKSEEESEPIPRKEFNSHQDDIDRKNKSKRKGMSEEVIELIEENYMEKTDDELRELIADKFGIFHATDKIESYRETNGMGSPTGWRPPEEIDEEEED